MKSENHKKLQITIYKELVKKTVKQKKIFEDILNSYKKAISDINNVKDLFNLAAEEKDDQTIEDCNLKIEQILKEIKKYIEKKDIFKTIFIKNKLINLIIK